MPEPRDATAPCPDLAELLLASEGELSKRRQSEVSAHLRLCSACREQLGSVGLALREYQDAVTEASATTRAAEADASADRLEVFRDRLQDERRTQTANRVRLPFRRWLPVAAAVPVLVGALFFSNRYTSVLRAEELLTKAAAQEQTVPANTVRRLEIHIKRTGVRTTRDVGTSARLVSVSESTAADVELTRRLTASHLDPQDPLSIRAFRTWHDSLRAKTDSVSPAGRDALALHTETDDGVLRSVELIVRRIDFQPLRATFAFADLGEVEITELSRWVAPASTTVAEHSAPATPGARLTGPTRSALDDAEIDVRTALHRAGADWKTTVAVSRSGSTVEIRGHVDAEEKAQIARAVDRIELAKLILRPQNDAASAVSLAETVQPTNDAALAPSGETTIAVPVVPLQRWLDRTFGRSGHSGNFVPVLTDAADQVQHRARAFAALAARYPEAETRKLNPAAREKLDALVDAQYRDLVSAVEGLDDRLALFLGTSSRPAIGQVAPRPWQACAVAVARRADRLNDAIRQVLRERDLPLPTELEKNHAEPASLADLRQAADAVWDQVRSSK